MPYPYPADPQRQHTAPATPARSGAGRGYAAALGLLVVLGVASLFLNWKKFTSTFDYRGSNFVIKVVQGGYGDVTYDMTVDGEVTPTDHSVEPLYLITMILALALLVVGAVLISLSKARRTGTFLAALGGVLLIGVALLNMIVNDADSMLEEASEGQIELYLAFLRGGELSTGIGCFLALTVGILAVVVAGFALFAMRSRRAEQQFPGNPQYAVAQQWGPHQQFPQSGAPTQEQPFTAPPQYGQQSPFGHGTHN